MKYRPEIETFRMLNLIDDLQDIRVKHGDSLKDYGLSDAFSELQMALNNVYVENKGLGI